MHIIVGVDDSVVSRRALRWATWAARRSGASVEAVRSWAYSPMLMRQLQGVEEMDRDALAGLEAVIADVVRGEIEIRTTVVRGPAHHAVHAHVVTHAPSLVVVGRRTDDERITPKLLGSVSRKLVDAAPCPVVVVSDHIVPDDADHEPVAVVAFDGSPHSERALHWAVDFIQAIGGRIVLTHAVGFVGRADQGSVIDEQAAAMLKCAADDVTGAGVACSTVVSHGDPRRAIEEVADDHDADLIVIGPRGVGGISKLVLGTVAAHLTQYADRPVAVIPKDWQPTPG